MSELKQSADGRFIYGAIDPTTGEAFTLQRVTRWLDNSLIKQSHIDNILFFELSDGTHAMRVWPRDVIDMRCYLVGDGYTDNKVQWARFNTYMGQAIASFRLHLTIPYTTAGYSYSGGVAFVGQRYYIENYGRHLFPKSCTGWLFAGVDNADYEVAGLGVWNEAVEQDPTDGLVANNDQSYLDWLTRYSVPNDWPVWNGQTLQEYMNKPAGTLVKSLRDTDYKYHGVQSCHPINFRNFLVKGFSGHGYYHYAPAIQQSDPILAPSRFNSSYSGVTSGKIFDCGGYAGVVNGADANQVKFNQVDFYNSGCGNFLDLSQTGSRLFQCSEQNARAGGYMMLCGGKPGVIECYSEVDGRILNFFSGIATGILNKGYRGGGLVQQGSDFSGITATAVHVKNSLFFGSPSNPSEALFVESSSSGGVSVRIGGETAKQALLEIHDARQPLYRGRWMGASGVATERLTVGGLRNEVASGFAPPAGGKWYPGGELKNKLYDGTNTRKWVCKAAGLAPGDTYAALCGVTVTTRAGMPQHLDLSAPTTFIELWDMFTLPGQNGGQPVQVVGVFPSSGPITAIDVSQAVNVSQAMPVYPTALFQAITS